MKHRGKHRHFQTKIKKITENSFLAEQKNDFEKLNQKKDCTEHPGISLPCC